MKSIRLDATCNKEDTPMRKEEIIDWLMITCITAAILVSGGLSLWMVALAVGLVP